MWHIILFVLCGRFLLRFISIYKTETSKRICLFYGKNWTLSVYKNSRDSSDFYGHVFVGLLLFRELILATLHQRTHFTSDQFFKKNLEDISPFCGATDTPVLDFWWHLPWSLKPGWIPSLACAQSIPQIHLWCNTCWPLGSQHGSRAISSTYFCTGIGRGSSPGSRTSSYLESFYLKSQWKNWSIEFFFFNCNCQWIHWI